MTQQKQEQVSSEVVTDHDGYEPIPVPNATGVKQARLLEIKTDFESKLQVLIAEASRIRKMGTDAKTAYKRQFYDKKFAKVNKSVRETVLAIQQIQHLITKSAEDVNAASNGTTTVAN